jgi:DNA topoisomerase-1
MGPKQYRRTKAVSSVEEKSLNISGHSNYLVIVESPSKCAKIEEYLGFQYTCIASKGHFRYVEGLKKIDSKNDYAITFSIVEEKKSHVKLMYSVISKFAKENIYLATDDDREGEAIAWHICDVFHLPIATTKRILFHEITRPAIQHAIQNPTTVNMSLVQAQHARQVLDLLVGFKVSPVLWKHIQGHNGGGLSAGRCQTPALRLVYENEEKRLAAGDQGELNYKIVGYFTAKNIPFQLCSTLPSVEEVMEFFSKTKKWQHILSFSATKQSTKSPPQPFTTSKLLQVASNILHFSPKTTMDLCQSLYQSGMITYMRTDSTKYSPVFLASAREYITRKLEKPEFVGNLEKIATNEKQENPHEAIRCTNIYANHYSSANPLLTKMYRLIWKNTVESCMTTATYNQTIAMLSAPDAKTYSHTIEIPTHLGWKYISYSSFHKEHDVASEDQDGGDGGAGTDLTEIQNNGAAILFYLQSLAKEKAVEYGYIETILSSGKNKYPHYTEASLIQTLEDLGIGRPSTFASIVDTIVERGYVKKTNIQGRVVQCEEHKLYSNGDILTTKKEKVFGEEKGKLVIQPVGTITIQFLLGHFANLFEYGFTKKMEESLDNIEKDALKYIEKYIEVCKECNMQIKELLKPIAKMDRQEWPINDMYRLAFSKNGPVLKKLEEDGTVSFKSIKKNIDIDMEKLKMGEYTLEDLIEREATLGTYNGDSVILKNGRFGPYVECGEEKISVKTIVKSYDKIEYLDVLPYLHATFQKDIEADHTEKNKSTPVEMKSGNPSVLRIITKNLSIRKGRYGPYLFYQNQYMTKPQFLNLKKFPDNYHNCSPETLIAWVKETYEVDA